MAQPEASGSEVAVMRRTKDTHRSASAASLMRWQGAPFEW